MQAMQMQRAGGHLVQEEVEGRNEATTPTEARRWYRCEVEADCVARRVRQDTVFHPTE
jgi:hypothetical protein